MSTIAIDARFWGLENAGIGRYVMNLVKEIIKIDKENKYYILLREKYYNELSFPSNFEKVRSDLRHYGAKEQISLVKTLNSLSPDLVHFPHFNVPILYKGKFVVTIHDMLMHKNKGRQATTLPMYKYFVKRLGYKLVFKNSVLNSSQIIVPSMTVAQDLLKNYKINKSKLFVTYEGVDDKFAKKKNIKVLSKYSITKPYFIYAGNGYPHKNLDRAIEAFESLNKKEQKATLVIVSARDVFQKRLESRVRRQNARKSVKFLGFIPDHDLPALYAFSEGYLFPSLSEGFGLPGIEAMASGTLVLASDIPVFKEIYKDNAIYFNPYDFSSIRKSIADVLEMKPAVRKKMVVKSQKFVKKYTWDNMAKKTLEVYKEALKA